MIKPYDNDVLVQPYDKKWQGYRDSTITISKNYFEHLLNCLANQKYTNELLEDHKKNIQKAIDKAWGTQDLEMICD